MLFIILNMFLELNKLNSKNICKNVLELSFFNSKNVYHNTEKTNVCL